MKYGIKTIEDFNVDGKKVLVRVDINSTIDRKDNKLMNLLRIDELGATLNALKSAAVVIIAHQGRPGKKDYTSLKPHAEAMNQKYGNVKFVDDLYGEKAINAIKDLKTGEKLVLENVRFFAEEVKIKEPEKAAKTHFVAKLAPLFDLYVGDAYGAAHRSSPSLVGFPEVLPSCMGKILEKEIDLMEEKIFNATEHPVVFLIGGAKVETKFKVLKNLLENNKADQVLVCGLLQNIMLAGAGIDIGAVNKKPIKGFDDYVPTAKEIMSKYGDKILLPDDLALNDNGQRREVTTQELLANPNSPSNDIGQKTIDKYAPIIKEAAIVVANGPPGVFEIPPFDMGSNALLKAMAEGKAYAVVGGGEMGGLAKDLGLNIDFISTGGGAMLEYLTGKELPVIASLRKAAQK